MAAEMQALVPGFDFSFLIRNLAQKMLGNTVSIEAMIDLRTVFHIVAKDARTCERRPQRDALALRPSFDEGELSRIAWIPGCDNPA